ncbi:class I SAM-dependent methyltransferase [Thermosynechococcus sp.]|uniref:class I SAM-dependent methyltransferase n=1 Tax=Thermosynechococcus sp. TaxID=2814275 RepID=UPI003919E73D
MIDQRDNFQQLWEELRREGKQTARYPYDKVISFIFRNYPRNIPRNDIRILEVGCGAGNNLWPLAREGFRVYGIEGSSTAVEIAHQQLAEYGLSGQIYCQDFTQKYPFENDFFHLIFDRGSLTCVSYAAVSEAFDEIYRVLRKGGLFFFNPYSTEHSSFPKLLFSDNETYVDVVVGSIAGTGKVCFYTKDMILKLFAEQRWKLNQIKHLTISNLLKKCDIHAEWEVIAEKL